MHVLLLTLLLNVAGIGIDLWSQTFNRNIVALILDNKKHWFKGCFNSVSTSNINANQSTHLLLSQVSTVPMASSNNRKFKRPPAPVFTSEAEAMGNWSAGHVDLLFRTPLYEWGFFNSPNIDVTPTALIPLSFSVHCEVFIMVMYYYD
jgi:hypothetical protein